MLHVHEVTFATLYDYQNDLKRYPEWQEYLGDKPLMLIVWVSMKHFSNSRAERIINKNSRINFIVVE